MKTPPGQGGWQMFHTWHAGADTINPASNQCDSRQWRARPGSAGPTFRRSKPRSTAWYEAKTLDEEKAAMRRLNKAALDNVVYAPTGFFLMYQAWRKNVTGVSQGPAAVLLGRRQDGLIALRRMG